MQDWAAWGVFWGDSFGSSWGPLHQVEERPRRGGQSPGTHRTRTARAGRWNPHTQPIAARHYDRDEEALLLLM